MDRKQLKELVEDMLTNAPERKFTESVDIAINLRDVNLKDPTNRFQIDVVLPHEFQKDIKICVIAEGSQLVEAETVGVEKIVTKQDLKSFGNNPNAAKNLAKHYDFFVASAPLMPLVGQYLGRYLGPRGKMPTPIPPTAPIEPILDEFKHKVKLRLRQSPVIHARVGTENMEIEEIVENVQSLVNAVERKLEKGEHNIKTIYLKTTMSPPTRIK